MQPLHAPPPPHTRSRISCVFCPFFAAQSALSPCTGQSSEFLECGPPPSNDNVSCACVADATSAGRPKGKASRVLGRDGRTLHNIIEDAIIRIRTLKNIQGKGADAMALPASETGNDFPHRQGLLSGNNLWTLELELPNFKVVAMSEGLKEWCSKEVRSGEERSRPAPISYLCEIAHPDDEFALRKTVADQKMAGTRISFRLEQRSAAQDAAATCSKDKTCKKQAGKQAAKGKQEKKEETSYLKVDMLLAGITSGTRRLVLISPKASEAAQVLQEALAPASLEQQQQRWQKREQRIQHRFQANEIEQQNKKQQQQPETSKGAEAKRGAADQESEAPAVKVEPVEAAAAAAAGAATAAKLLEGAHASVAAALVAPATDGQGAAAGSGMDEASIAAANAQALGGLAALLNAPVGGGAGANTANLESGALAPLLQLAMQYSLSQQVGSADGTMPQPNAALLGALAANPLAGPGTWPVAAGSAHGNERFMQYLSALAALSGGGADALASNPLLALAGAEAAGGVKGKGGKAAAVVGGIKGANGKAPAKGKGKTEKGKKSSPFEAEEVEVAATLALLRNHPNPAMAAAAKTQSARLAAADGASSYSSMVGCGAADAKGKGAGGVGIKRERDDKGAAGEAGARRAGDSTESNAEEGETSAVMDDREARRMRRKKMRKLQKTLAVELDLLLPRLGANNKSYKWAGRRSVGRTGRSLVEILVDTAKSVRAIREANANGDAAGRSVGGVGGADVGGVKGVKRSEEVVCAAQARPAGHYAFYKQGLLASQNLAVVEVSLPDLTILASSDAFRCV